jgi:hypothetical protein
VVDNRWFSTATNSDLDRIQHGYDRASNRLWRKNTVADAAGIYLDELYSYDGLYRLTELERGQLNSSNSGIVSGTLSFAQAWGPDATGNWQQFWQNSTGASWNLQQSRSATLANEITSIVGGGWDQPSYDGAGNMLEFPQPASATTSLAATFDAWNRTVSLSSAATVIQQHEFDGLMRRTTKTSSGSLRHFYYSEDWQSLEERLGSSSSADRQFVWGQRYIDDLVLRDWAGERFYAIQDPNWNVVAICDASGSVDERYIFSGYGEITVLDGAFALRPASLYAWETGFAGYRIDLESLLLLARRRFYHPLLGCWITVDPLGLIIAQATSTCFVTS